MPRQGPLSPIVSPARSDLLTPALSTAALAQPRRRESACGLAARTQGCFGAGTGIRTIVERMDEERRHRRSPSRVPVPERAYLDGLARERVCEARASARPTSPGANRNVAPGSGTTGSDQSTPDSDVTV